MTAAFDERLNSAKQAAILRTLAAQVVAPVAAGRKSKKALTPGRKKQWDEIVNRVVACSPDMQVLSENAIANAWKHECQFYGIGHTRPLPLVGWVFAIPGFWTFFLPLLIELAKLWIASNRDQETQP